MKFAGKFLLSVLSLLTALSMTVTAFAADEESYADSEETAVDSVIDYFIDNPNYSNYNIRKIETNKEYTEQILFSRYLYERGTWSRNNIISDYVDWFGYEITEESTMSIDFEASMDALDMFVTFYDNNGRYAENGGQCFYEITAVDIKKGHLPYYKGNYGVGKWSLKVLSENAKEVETSRGIAIEYDKNASFDISGRMTFENIPAGTECILGIKQDGMGCGYGTQMVTFKVNTAPVPKNVKSISVKKAPKTEYFTGEALDVTGGEILVTYDNGTFETKPITADMVSGFSTASAGSRELTVTYGNASAKYTINVTAVAVTSVKLLSQPKSDYFIDDKPELTGLQLKAEYNNGDSKIVDVTEAMLKGFNTSKEGKYKVTVSYGGKSDSFDITVSVDPKNANVIYTIGGKTAYSMQLSEVFKVIGNDTGSINITINKTITENKLTFPAKAEKVTLTSANGAVLKTSATSLAPKSDLVLNCAIEQTGGKAITVKVPAGKTLTVQKALDTAVELKGTKTSGLIMTADLTANSVTTFAYINTGSHKLTVNKTLKAVDKFSGKLIAGTQTAIGTTENASLELSSAAAAKTTITDITGTLNITLDNGEKLSGAVPMFTYKGKAEDFYDKKINISNETKENQYVKAYLYKKTVKAEYPGALTLQYDGKTIYYPNFETAFSAMNDPSKDYTIAMNNNVIVSGKFALPAKAHSITISAPDSQMMIDLGKTASITAKSELKLNGIDLTADGKPVAVKMGKYESAFYGSNIGTLTTSGSTVLMSTNVNGAVKGGAGGIVIIDSKVSGEIKGKGVISVENSTIGGKLTGGAGPVALKSNSSLGGALSTKGEANVSNASINGALKAGAFTLNGVVSVKGAVTVNGLSSAVSGTRLTAQSLAVKKDGIKSGSAAIVLKLVDASGNLCKFTTGDIVVKTFKLAAGATYTEGSLLVETLVGDVPLKFEKNKLIL